ncbi:hypothetical protein A3Q56_05151 [Intoshia linei]|uniref:Uncharacterized protein n=1 Tax=Intoshia linei TaxID=1819745 RepID=A0A177AYP4_9BILA|nr:hypothetical protein A3Q56_05151 [Intoshia linei]
MLPKNGKPFSNDQFLTDCFLGISDELFQSSHNTHNKICDCRFSIITKDVSEQNTNVCSNYSNHCQFVIKYNNNFKCLLGKAFLSANIPFSKLQNKHMKKLFDHMKFLIPSETSMRSVEKSLYQNNLNIIKDYSSNGEEFFMIVDETNLNGEKFSNFLISLASKPSISYLVYCGVLESSPNNIYVKNKIFGVISSVNINSNNFILLLTHAASYMVLGSVKLKSENFILENGVEIIFRYLMLIPDIMHNYYFLYTLIKQYCSVKYKISDAIDNLNFKRDPAMRRIEKKGVFKFMGIEESNPIMFDNVQPSIIAFPITWLVEAGFLAIRGQNWM